MFDNLLQQCYNVIIKGGEDMTKTKRIAFRLDDNDFEMIKDICEERGQTMTDFIMFCIMDAIDSNDEDYDMNLKGGE